MLLGFGNVQIRNEITLTKTGEEIGKQSDSFSVSIVDPLPPPRPREQCHAQN